MPCSSYGRGRPSNIKQLRAASKRDSARRAKEAARSRQRRTKSRGRR